MVDTLTDDELIEAWRSVQRELSDAWDTKTLDRHVALRREGHRRGIDMHSIPPMPRSAEVVRRELEDIERRMQRLHRRAYTRARATAREANLGQLARIADALRDELRRAEEVAG